MDDSFGDALARAKQLAAKYSSSANGGSGMPMKRSADDSDDFQQPQKRAYVNEKVAQAAEAAARINQKLGGPTNPIGSSYGGHEFMPRMGQGPTSIIHKVPDHLVGLIIGKKGEQITRIQKESGCNVQIAPDSGGKPERDVTLTGTDEQIDAVKRMIGEILEKANPSGGFNNSFSSSQNMHHIDISIPGPKAGLIIGKNGETIKQLQEQAGVKMVLIQDSNTPTDYDKPLRITGEPAKVERAKQMVIDLLNSRLTLSGNNFSSTGAGGGGGGGGGGYQSSKPSTTFAVPSEKAGLVIGKGGETVKEIMRQSGAHVEIQRQPSPNPTIKIFNISGEQSQIDYAIRLICEKASVPPPAQNSAYSSPQYGGGQQQQYGQGVWGQQTAAAAAYGGQWAQSQATAAAGATSTMPAPVVNPQTGQPDYTAAWVEYYRRQGMHAQAEAILRQSQSGQAQPSTQTTAQTTPTTATQQQQQTAAGAGAGGYDYSQWSQYGQWQQQWQQQQQQQQYPTSGAAGWNQGQQQAPGTSGQRSG